MEGRFIDINEPMNPHMQGLTRGELEPSDWEERHRNLLKSAEKMKE